MAACRVGSSPTRVTLGKARCGCGNGRIVQRGVTARILGETANDLSPADAITAWGENYKAAITRTDQLIIEMRISIC